MHIVGPLQSIEFPMFLGTFAVYSNIVGPLQSIEFPMFSGTFTVYAYIVGYFLQSIEFLMFLGTFAVYTNIVGPLQSIEFPMFSGTFAVHANILGPSNAKTLRRSMRDDCLLKFVAAACSPPPPAPSDRGVHRLVEAFTGWLKLSPASMNDMHSLVHLSASFWKESLHSVIN